MHSNVDNIKFTSYSDANEVLMNSLKHQWKEGFYFWFGSTNVLRKS